MSYVKHQEGNDGRMLAHTNVSLTYRAEVIGDTWGGFEGTYAYSFDHEPTAKEIRSRAGDFQSINDYRVVCDRRTQIPNGYQVEHIVVEPWKREESELKYLAAME